MRQSQSDRILARLQATPNQFVAMPELARIGSDKPTGFCMVHSRIADLRRAGHDVEHRGTGGFSEYRLVVGEVDLFGIAI
jgi:hypothetical protein